MPKVIHVQDMDIRSLWRYWGNYLIKLNPSKIPCTKLRTVVTNKTGYPVRQISAVHNVSRNGTTLNRFGKTFGSIQLVQNMATTTTSQMNGDAKDIEKIIDSKFKLNGPHQQKFPICDTELESADIDQEEKVLRCKLAALYRLIDFHGWIHLIYNHITARVSEADEHFLINPFGLMYYEITASSLMKIDIDGNTLDAGSTDYGCNQAGWTLHSAIHDARPDIKCVIHLHTPAGAAVSSMKCGLLRCCQESLIVGEVAYHPYSGILVDEKERKLIAKNLGPTTKIMILHNHGLAICGETIEEAYYLTVLLMAACETQVRLMSCGGLDNMILMDEEMMKKVRMVAGRGGGGVSKDSSAWKFGQLEFEGAVRIMDNMGLKSGYPYKKMIKADKRKIDEHDLQDQQKTSKSKRGKK